MVGVRQISYGLTPFFGVGTVPSKSKNQTCPKLDVVLCATDNLLILGLVSIGRVYM